MYYYYYDQFCFICKNSLLFAAVKQTVASIRHISHLSEPRVLVLSTVGSVGRKGAWLAKMAVPSSMNKNNARHLAYCFYLIFSASTNIT